MITFRATGQRLEMDSAPYIVADSIDYITAKFYTSADWEGLALIAHFTEGDDTYDFELSGGEITEDMHLNLAAGTWSVNLTGTLTVDGTVTKRITTNTVALIVRASGVLSGEPAPITPASLGEQILAAANNAVTVAEEAKSAALTAQDSATAKAVAAAVSATLAGTAKTSAEAAQVAAETAKTGAETAQANAIAAKTGAEASKTGAEEAQGAAETAKAGAEAAQLAAETAKADAQTAQAAAQVSAEGASNSAASAAATLAGAATKQTAANALHKTISGTALRADDVSPLAHNLSVVQYGQCVQDGTPTPQAPIAITGKAAGASVYAGKNLINPLTARPGFISSTTGELLGPDSPLYRCSDYIPVIPGTVYTQSNTPSGTSAGYAWYDKDKVFLVGAAYAGLATERVLTAPANAAYVRLTVSNNGIVLDRQLELGSTATAYEPYTAPITQTVTDSNGEPVTLYGVPVTSGGNVTIGGQIYIADTLEGTTVTRRVGHIASYNGETITTAYISSTGELSTGADVYYVLDTPTTEPVTVSPAMLPANSPTTTWTSEAYSEVTYNRDINKAYNDLAAAIVALGGTI